MGEKSAVRPGGRSARVQRAVHEAVQALDEEVPRDKLTVPQVAERAGVTPSTIYRRWGNLKELLADVAAERLQPDAPVADTGSLESDLMAWAGVYMEEMRSTPGQQMLADTLGSASTEQRQRCLQAQQDQLRLILSRAEARGETPLPTVEALLDGIMAPLTYRLSYAPQTLSKACLERWVAATLR
ncbi:TetR/AcrR family transcriptional regulator [Halomonas elongata]|uniref:TetR family transcription regulator n=1 Tax=Halomonas elongata (strain ATCC 33173 / DSM 2581 / NBRC 15536 / NCIMB 2198 / 1H9) TaxID=768066 RepID=E1V6L9_HALED|nr:TetR/AcrR family transcriptional regulator [Halomonas elongata]MBW5800961.1 TetR/AcrR family transcriptional regulator [Halomonas elongata]WBF18583.1 TetR/AcrR family transcriptional regulator [Halomonas elongata]WPU47437.1 TetR/AcrR family transcriptional regulator [Halomonas elongata DSM 2581]CBV41348.1 TetR family transcription regulator [Halomonas elongata DSM 2581]